MFERRRAEDPFTLHRSPPLGSAGVSPALLTLGGRPIFPRGSGVRPKHDGNSRRFRAAPELAKAR